MQYNFGYNLLCRTHVLGLSRVQTTAAHILLSQLTILLQSIHPLILVVILKVKVKVKIKFIIYFNYHVTFFKLVLVHQYYQQVRPLIMIVLLSLLLFSMYLLLQLSFLSLLLSRHYHCDHFFPQSYYHHQLMITIIK